MAFAAGASASAFGANGSVGNCELAGFTAQGGEERGIRSGHKGLESELPEPAEERGATLRIEVGDDFVEKQQRGHAADLRDNLGMRQNQANEQRLLLAG